MMDRSVIPCVLPDVTVFGQYTYLVTELLWGSVALALLYYAGAFRAAARTVAVLYPPAFLWDWYTLEVGVFAIPMRTGVELLGVPVEEHIFMILVPAMVVGTHESLRKLRGPAGSGAGDPADESEHADAVHSGARVEDGTEESGRSTADARK